MSAPQSGTDRRVGRLAAATDRPTHRAHKSTFQAGFNLCRVAAVTLAWSFFIPTGHAQDEASVAYDEATAAYVAGNYQDALGQYQRAAQLSGSPNAWLGVARCLRHLGKTAEAVRAYEKTLVLASARAREDEQYEATKGSARSELAEVSAGVGRVRVLVRPEGVDPIVRIGADELEPEELGQAYAVAPGRVSVRVEGAGFEPVDRDVDVAPRQTLQIEVTLAAMSDDPEASSPEGSANQTEAVADDATLSTLGWLSLGVGAAAGATSLIFGLITDSKHDELAQQCVAKPCSADTHDDIASTGRTYELVTNLSFGIATVGIVAGVSLLVVEALGSADVQPSSLPSVALSADERGAQLRLQGVF